MGRRRRGRGVPTTGGPVMMRKRMTMTVGVVRCSSSSCCWGTGGTGGGPP